MDNFVVELQIATVTRDKGQALLRLRMAPLFQSTTCAMSVPGVCHLSLYKWLAQITGSILTHQGENRTWNDVLMK